MSFFWKYTRSGMHSKTYVSFIIDVLPSYIISQGSDYYWQTSLEELQIFLVLLQDVEVLNNSEVGILKEDYAKFIRQLNYEPTKNYITSGSRYKYGQAVMGRHTGSPLPWGFIDDKRTPVTVKITGLKYSAFPQAYNGLIPYSSEDKLKPFRNHPQFESTGVYWDYMPFHSCIIPFVQAMLKTNTSRTKAFISNTLMWE